MGSLEFEKVHQPEQVGSQITQGIAGRAGRVGGRPAGVTDVVAQDVPAGGGQPVAELVLPIEETHSAAETHRSGSRFTNGGAALGRAELR